MPKDQRGQIAIYVFSVAVLVLIADRVSKLIVSHILVQGQSLKIFPNIFHLTLVLNKGAAFGFFKDQRAFFIAVAMLAVTVIIIYIFKGDGRGRYMFLPLGLIMGGAIGNLIDRVRFGCVIDFLDFRIWPVFNIADSCITIGMAILAMDLLLSKNAKVKR